MNLVTERCVQTVSTSSYVQHYTAQNSSDNLPPDNHHCSDQRWANCGPRRQPELVQQTVLERRFMLFTNISYTSFKIFDIHDYTTRF